jgi:16S rRNA (guanine966-N2)-methyltransferase
MKSVSRNRENSLRIIAGEWRGRLLDFPDIQGLRPTPDRVRETLFNWLQSYVQGANCLDLFSGSGAMGFEALSRGAAKVTMIEANKSAFLGLQRSVEILKGEAHVSLKHMDAFEFLKAEPEEQFDIIFVDPPYGKKWVSECLSWLAKQDLLRRHGRVYIEYESSLAPEQVIDEHWQLLKHKTAGQVTYGLLQAK